MFAGLLGGFKLLKYGIVLAIIVAIVGSAWWYHSSTLGRIAAQQVRIEQLTTANATLELNNRTLVEAVATANETVTKLEATYDRIRADYTALNNEFQVIRSQNDELANRLGRHELDVLASRKPGLVENVINDATADVMRCFELQSGAPLNESERNATTANAFNSECPWMFSATSGN